MTRVLILGAAAVQADAVASARAKGHKVHVCAAIPGPASPLADATADFSFTERDLLADYVHRNDIDVVYSVGSDVAMPVIGWIGEALGLPYLVGEQVAAICNNKTLMRAALAAHDFSGNAWFVTVEPGDAVPQPGRPVIVKPADSQGQRGIARVDSGDLTDAVSAAQAASRTGTAIVEEWLEGPEVSVNGYLVDGVPALAVVSDRHVWPEHVGLVSGHTMPPTTISDEQAEATAVMVMEAARLLGIQQGPVYAQVKATEDGPRLVEISPRLDGCHLWAVIRECYGIDLIDAVWTHLIDGAPPTFPEVVADRTVGIDFVCAPPGTRASFDGSEDVRYYEPGQEIRAINGRFEKIGYRIGDRAR